MHAPSITVFAIVTLHDLSKPAQIQNHSIPSERARTSEAFPSPSMHKRRARNKRQSACSDIVRNLTDVTGRSETCAGTSRPLLAPDRPKSFLPIYLLKNLSPPSKPANPHSFRPSCRYAPARTTLRKRGSPSLLRTTVAAPSWRSFTVCKSKGKALDEPEKGTSKCRTS
jgi:hypothetical protein